MDINLESYKVFYYVASTGSFSEAAKKLFISQSAVSQSIKNLEQKLATPLFARTSKMVQLTAAGEILYSSVEPAMSLISQAETKLTNAGTLTGGQIHIGASDTICRYFLVPYLKIFHTQYPNITIKVTNQTSSYCADLLMQGKVDLCLVNSPNSHLRPDMMLQTVGSFQDVFVAGPTFYELKNQKISLGQLLHYPLLMLDASSTTNHFLHLLFQEQNLNLIPNVELSSNDLLIDLAKINLGIAFVPDFCVPVDKDPLFQVPTVESIPRRQIVAACQSSRANLPVIHAFLELLPKLV